MGELRLANEVVAQPNQVVLKYGDAIGRNGSDIISLDVKTGNVYLWDFKYRSTNSKLGHLQHLLIQQPEQMQSARPKIRLELHS
ncbi:hypothetical protein [Acinetobacter lactucae]|uniref:hypothetical protein n=1 Tax=Acinetobacter lactucae TaxID=1785128 RepID=UPI00077E3942|nr:hypothetical protein [Acinetobacter lactucae]